MESEVEIKVKTHLRSLRTLEKRISRMSELLNRHRNNMHTSEVRDTLENAQGDYRIDYILAKDLKDLIECYPYYFSKSLTEDPVAVKLRSLYQNGKKVSVFGGAMIDFGNAISNAHFRIAQRKMKQEEYEFLLNSTRKQIICAVKKYGSQNYFKGGRK